MQNEENPSSNPTRSALLPGQKLAGCYVLNREISSESEMSVWLAHDEVLGKEVSLHFVPSAILGDPRGMTELRQEVKRNRQLIHPNILRVYDFVEDGGLAAVSMDRFEGASLAAELRKNGAFTPVEVQPWIQQLAGTLDDAHRVQLFHRDLSPANIYLKPNGGLFVTNFGVSRSIRDALERTRSQPQESLHLAYMSPQQVDGDKPAKTDDVYGLGVLAFELISGKLPFTGADIVPAIRTVVAPKISDALGAAVPHAWESMVAACLSKKPEFRPATCSSAAALLNVASDAPTETGGMIPVVPTAPKPLFEKKDDLPSIPAVGTTSGFAMARSSAVERRVSFGGSNSVLPAATAPLSAAADLAKVPAENLAPPEPAKASEANSPQFPPVPPDAGKSRPTGAKSDLPANFPELTRPRSKWPAIGIGLAAGLLAFAVVQKMKTPKNDAAISAVTELPPGTGLGSDTTNAVEPLPVPKDDELPKPNPPVATQPPTDEPLPLPKPAVAVNATPQPIDLTPVTPTENSTAKPPAPTPKPLKRIGIIGADLPPVTPPKVVEEVKPTPPPVVVNPPADPPAEKTPPNVLGGASIKLPALPELPAKLQIPLTADAAALEKLMNERIAAEAALKQTAGTAEQAQQEVSKLSDASKKDQDTLRKTLDERRKALAPALKENEALLGERKKREDEMAKAEALALEARKAADAAKTAHDTLVQQSGPKLEAMKKADDELKLVAQQLISQQKQSDELAKSQTQVTSLRQQASLGLLQIEKEKALISTAVEKAKAGALEAMRVQNQTKIAEIQKKIQVLDAEAKKSEGVLTQLKDLGEAGIAASKPISTRLDALNAQIQGFRDEISKLGGAGTAVIPPAPAPAPVPPPAPAPQPKPASQAADGANSIGMRFAQVGDVDFSVYLVTRKDYEVFATEKGLHTGTWRPTGFAQGPDHPVASVTWKEADAFCKWLTERERKSGQLKASEQYRLPTDLEWSRAVGLPPEQGATPEDRDLSSEPGIDGVFPWGLDWPPPSGAGNYAGEENDSEVKIQGYRDDYQGTSPVGKFKPNAYGLFDMGGNLWQWTNDYLNNAKEKRVLRGGSWYNGGLKLTLLSSSRIGGKPDEINDTYGFRVVRTRDGAKAGAVPR